MYAVVSANSGRVCGQQDKFQTMSDQIVGRIDDMGARIDQLEQSLSDLMAQVAAGLVY